MGEVHGLRQLHLDKPEFYQRTRKAYAVVTTSETQLYANLVLRSAKRHWEIKTVLYQYTATQKYQWFLQAYPELICHVSGRHIASFLGMTPVTLSRLKRTLHEQARKR